MRNFLKPFLFVVTGLLAAAFIASFSLAQEELKEEAKATKAAVAELTEQERALHKDLATVEDEMKVLEQAIAEKEKALAGLEQVEADIDHKREALQAQREETSKELTELLRKLWPIHVLNTTQRGRAMETWDQADREFTWLAALYERAGSKMQEIGQQNAALRNTLEEQKQAAEKARAELASINQDKDRLLGARIEFQRRIAEVRKEKLSAEEELEQILAAIQDMEYKLKREAERKADEARRKEEEEKRQAEAARQAEEERLKAEAERQAEEERKQAEAARRAEQERLRTALEEARAEFEPKPMPSLSGRKAIGGLKGKLPWPVERGNLRLSFKENADPPHRGLGLSVFEREQVHAVAWGKVVHSDTLRGYGKVVILVHGEEYFSLYAYLAETSVEVGEEVDSGQVIGRAGYFPELKGPGLYFELRFHQKAINPKAWLASLN
ncbi:murein hydrolase activator EnvC family protein [Oceanidesulfovibrio indonesiensis]|nr:peptidoglycan DD-metalloendopeptidase family protein [Oceanidesulfovibrio indonesiensis]